MFPIWKYNKETVSNPFRQLETLQSDLGRFFDFPLLGWSGQAPDLFDGTLNPAIDVYDEKNNYVVKADLPGLSKEDIDVSVVEDTLVIRGEKKHERKTESKNFLREERYFGTFQRAVALPSSVDVDHIKAAYNNGVLELILPKKEDAKPKRIDVDIN